MMREPLERGDVQFFWTPSVQPADAEELALAVQSLFAILSPKAERIAGCASARSTCLRRPAIGSQLVLVGECRHAHEDAEALRE